MVYVDELRRIVATTLSARPGASQEHARFLDQVLVKAKSIPDPDGCTKHIEFVMAALVTGSVGPSGVPEPGNIAMTECDQKILLGCAPRFNWAKSI